MRAFALMPLVVPRPGDPEDSVEQEQKFAAYLRARIEEKGWSIERLRRAGVDIAHNVSGLEQMTRAKLARVISITGISGSEASRITRKYAGGSLQTMQDHVLYWLRRDGRAEVIQRLRKAGACSSNVIDFFQYGMQSRKGGRVDDTHHPPLAMWRRIARTMGIREAKTYAVWRTDTARYLQNAVGLNAFGTEMEILFREFGQSFLGWRENCKRPASLRGMKEKVLKSVLGKARRGVCLPWPMVERICKAFPIDERRIREVESVWWSEMVQPERLADFHHVQACIRHITTSLDLQHSAAYFDRTSHIRALIVEAIRQPDNALATVKAAVREAIESQEP